MTGDSSLARPSPNIWHHTEAYEIENRGADPDRRLRDALMQIGDWTGRDLLDLGCGTGFHLRDFAVDARQVVGIEPHPPLAALAARRVRTRQNVTVSAGSADATGLASSSVDILHARWVWACESEEAVAEMARVLRPGGVAMIVDNDASRSTFGRWFARARPDRAGATFWADRGWQPHPVEMGWRFASRADLEAVVAIELAPEYADGLLSEVSGTEVDYAVTVWSRRF
ncbi:MAG: class I SAM-dependent methyltransferase [Nocardioides sp.]